MEPMRAPARIQVMRDASCTPNRSHLLNNNRRIERRKERSTNPVDALSLWLSSISRQNRLVGFVLADESGLLLASNMRSEKVEELAALAPLLVRRDQEGRRPLDRHQVPVSIQRVDTGGSAPVLLCALGEPTRRDRGLRAAAPGVRRILQQALTRPLNSA